MPIPGGWAAGGCADDGKRAGGDDVDDVAETDVVVPMSIVLLLIDVEVRACANCRPAGIVRALSA
jgi:hypothetical protein